MSRPTPLLLLGLLSALTLAACVQGADSSTPSPRTTIMSTVPKSMNKPATSHAQDRTVASIKADVATLDADTHVTTLNETKASSARRGNVTLTGYFYGDTLRKIKLEQPTTRTFGSERQPDSLVHMTHDNLVDGTPPETYYFAADGELILARTWGTRSQGGNTDYALQMVDYYFNGDEPLSRLVDGAPAAILNYAYQYDAVDLRKEIEGFVRLLNPSPSGG